MPIELRCARRASAPIPSRSHIDSNAKSSCRFLLPDARNQHRNCSKSSRCCSVLRLMLTTYERTASSSTAASRRYSPSRSFRLLVWSKYCAGRMAAQSSAAVKSSVPLDIYPPPLHRVQRSDRCDTPAAVVMQVMPLHRVKIAFCQGNRATVALALPGGRHCGSWPRALRHSPF